MKKRGRGVASRPKAQSEALSLVSGRHQSEVRLERLCAFFWDLASKGIEGERARVAFENFATEIEATEGERRKAMRSLCGTVDALPPWGRMIGDDGRH